MQNVRQPKVRATAEPGFGNRFHLGCSCFQWRETLFVIASPRDNLAFIMAGSSAKDNINNGRLGNKMDSAQCRAARALLGWAQDELAAASKVNKKTIADFERGARRPYDRTLRDLQEAMEAMGVKFLEDGEVAGGGTGVRLSQTSVP
ncbi:multiprotein-bridging factor 1 family protein [Magnetospirillum sp. XM-1]|uniref:helix-turn-helix domain-containing protein n=1 Tax=Magnetospirillum sp. XM-1 TaxID=1663591 RepID=UPI003518740D